VSKTVQKLLKTVHLTEKNIKKMSFPSHWATAWHIMPEMRFLQKCPLWQWTICKNVRLEIAKN
jgi:hypothetical protein